MSIKLEKTLEMVNDMKKDIKENSISVVENANDLDELEVRYSFLQK